jgi:hypothetical protein
VALDRGVEGNRGSWVVSGRVLIQALAWSDTADETTRPVIMP